MKIRRFFRSLPIRLCFFLFRLEELEGGRNGKKSIGDGDEIPSKKQKWVHHTRMPEMCAYDSIWQNRFPLPSRESWVKRQKHRMEACVVAEANTCVSGERLYDELMVYGNFYANSSHLTSTFFLRGGKKVWEFSGTSFI